MNRRYYLRTILLWALLVIVLASLFHKFGGPYHRAVAAAGEAMVSLWTPPGVSARIEAINSRFHISIGQGPEGRSISFDANTMGASAALFLATVLITPLGSAGRRALVAVAALAGLIVLMGLVMAGMALRPMLELEYLSSRVTWHLAALAHNATSSGLMITFPAALWFLLTLLWWRQDLVRVSRRNRFGPGVKSGKGGKKGTAARRGGKDRARRKRR